VASFWLSPAFLASAAVTLAAGCYSYVYLPMQMRKAYRQSLLTLARAVETKDEWSVGHGERVATFTAAVARELRLPHREWLKLEYATVLQDVGNVRVPHAILNKPGKLTSRELSILQSHTIVGAEIVEQVKFLKEIAPIIRLHHEAWDGSGYPDGLRGEEIPLSARILFVCTTFDSMIHTRAYRPGLDEDSAISEIRAGAGTKFDPRVVDAFLRVLKKHRKSVRAPS